MIYGRARVSKTLLPVALFLMLSCGPSPFASKPAEPAPKTSNATGPITPAEWKDLCEAQGERARRCPGPAPDSLAICTDTAACFGAIVRPEVIRELAKCEQAPDCRRLCTIDRAVASLPRSAATRDLEESCAMRRTVCPALDCNVLTRPVRPLDENATAPLIDCLRYEKSCLDVAACYLEKITPIVAKLNECSPGENLAGDDPDGGAKADASR